MAVPANLRVNARFPFPSLVQGSGPVTIAKANGIWTIGFSIAGLNQQVPPSSSYSTDFIIVWDAVSQSFFQASLSSLGAARTQRSVTATPIVVQPSDQIINCNINVNAACALPAASTRAGLPLTFVDLGQATAHPITITPNGTEKIDGVNAPVTLATNWSVLTLMPFNDGVNVGWKTT